MPCLKRKESHRPRRFAAHEQREAKRIAKLEYDDAWESLERARYDNLVGSLIVVSSLLQTRALHFYVHEIYFELKQVLADCNGRRVPVTTDFRRWFTAVELLYYACFRDT